MTDALPNFSADELQVPYLAGVCRGALPELAHTSGISAYGDNRVRLLLDMLLSLIDEGTTLFKCVHELATSAANYIDSYSQMWPGDLADNLAFPYSKTSLESLDRMSTAIANWHVALQKIEHTYTPRQKDVSAFGEAMGRLLALDIKDILAFANGGGVPRHYTAFRQLLRSKDSREVPEIIAGRSLLSVLSREYLQNADKDARTVMDTKEMFLELDQQYFRYTRTTIESNTALYDYYPGGKDYYAAIRVVFYWRETIWQAHLGLLDGLSDLGIVAPCDADCAEGSTPNSEREEDPPQTQASDEQETQNKLENKTTQPPKDSGEKGESLADFFRREGRVSRIVVYLEQNPDKNIDDARKALHIKRTGSKIRNDVTRLKIDMEIKEKMLLLLRIPTG